MTSDIVKEAKEAVEKGLPCGFLVPKLLEVIESQTAEIEILIRKKETLRDELAEKDAEIERLEYVLMAVMHSVDKWLEGDELKQDEANRACTMREKTLKITEKLHKKIDGLKKANQESWVAIERRKAEIERLKTAYKQCAWERDVFSKDANAIKSEAYREFAERFKNKATLRTFAKLHPSPYLGVVPVLQNPQYIIDCEIFDNLLKELTKKNDKG